MDLQIDCQYYIDVVDGWVVDQPKTVLLIFLLLSAGLSVGLGQPGTSSGTSQFTEDVAAYQASGEINDGFERVAFGEDTGATQLIQPGSNVLSKPELLRMLKAQQRLQANPELSVVQTTSVARTVARAIDPSAIIIGEEIDAVEQATPTEIDRVVQVVVEQSPSVQSSLNEDFNVRSASMSTTIGIVAHSLTTEASDSAEAGDDSPLTEIQRHAELIAGSVDGDIWVFSSGILSKEFSSVVGDSLALVMPTAAVLVLFFLIFACCDPIDLLIGVISLAMAVLWAFGFMGLAGIAFSQMFIAVPPLLLAIGIDFGTHAINRHHEKRTEGFDIHESMQMATDQSLVAFTVMTRTTVIDFAANTLNGLRSIRDFGIIAAADIVFTFFIFGTLLPTAKVYPDSLRERVGSPEFGSEPFGVEDSVLGRILPVGIHIARLASGAFLVLLVMSTVQMGYYGSGADNHFTQDSFLPPKDSPEYLELFPQQLQPRDYTMTEATNFLEDNFQTDEGDVTTVHVEGSLTDGGILESIRQAEDSPPNSFVVDDGHARETSIITIIQSYAERDLEFAALVARNDRDADGIPDNSLKQTYDELFGLPAHGQALNYITDDYTSARAEYAVESDAGQADITEDTRAAANRYRVKAAATGNVMVLEAVSDVIAQSAFINLVLALSGSTVFLIIIYTLLEGRPSLGIVNLVPVMVTVAGIAVTIRCLDIPFNVITGTILPVEIGLDIDYSTHLIHRFVEEYDEGTDVFTALTDLVRGTGGAFTGGMLTTVTGIGVLVITITPILGQFGLLIGVSILYSYMASFVVLSPALVVQVRLVHDGDAESTDAASGPGDADGAV